MSEIKQSTHLQAPIRLSSIISDIHAKGEKGKPLTRVLIIDDEPNLLYSTKSILEANDYHCTIADGGEAGLNVLNNMPVDIVLLDLSMPEIDGYEVLEQIHQRKIDVDVIIVSGEASFDNATRVFRNGALDFLSKPYKPQQLISILKNIAHKRELKKQLKIIQLQLEESELRYRFIVSNSPDIIYMIDHRGFFVFINDRVTELLGYKPTELVGEHFSTLVHDEDLNNANFIFNERRTGDRASQNVELKLKCSNPEKEAKTFESSSIVIELCSMGIYENRQDGTPYLGTYGVARDISERKKAQEIIHFQAYHDLLTKLPNRELFLDRLNLSIAQSVRNKNKLAVLFLDIDGFKFINDTLGHVIGDQLLQNAARRLQNSLRDSDTVSRIGGDEFNILVPELQSHDEAGRVAQKILKNFTKPIVLDNHEITISLSIGISVFPDDADNTDQLIKNSDMAMYHIKERGKNGFQYYSDGMQSIYSHRLNIEQDIRKALEQQQFEAYYQPQYDINSHKIVGLEALIRWNHPEKGLIYPDGFIPIAEEIGLINEIGSFMLDTGCKQLRSWIDSGIDNCKLSINVSTHQLTETNFDSILCSLVEQYDIPRNRLMIEITETTLMLDLENVLPRLKNLASNGIGISIDDFGVGYSSLSYLQSLPIEVLKIDRSFLNGLTNCNDSNCIIKAIIAMAKELELGVIIEGVETDQQLEYIKEIGCSVVQGFLLGYPLPEKEITSLLLKSE